MLIIHDPFIEGKYKLTGDTRVIMIDAEHEEGEIQWPFSTSISTDAG